VQRGRKKGERVKLVKSLFRKSQPPSARDLSQVIQATSSTLSSGKERKNGQKRKTRPKKAFDEKKKVRGGSGQKGEGNLDLGPTLSNTHPDRARERRMIDDKKVRGRREIEDPKSIPLAKAGAADNSTVLRTREHQNCKKRVGEQQKEKGERSSGEGGGFSSRPDVISIIRTGPNVCKGKKGWQAAKKILKKEHLRKKKNQIGRQSDKESKTSQSEEDDEENKDFRPMAFAQMKRERL